MDVREVMGSILGPNRVLDEDVKTCLYCCYVLCVTLLVGGMPMPKKGATYYHAQFGFTKVPKKGRGIQTAIKSHFYNRVIKWPGVRRIYSRNFRNLSFTQQSKCNVCYR